MKEEAITKLKARKSPTPSRWRVTAESRRANRSWLRYSQQVAMMMLDKMEDLNMTQKALAERMGCSQQYVSKILKGRETPSVETKCKIEGALQLELLPQVAELVEETKNES